MADKYLLRVTAGPTYDPATHKTIQVNTSQPCHISNSICDANISVRIQNYRGLPRNSPTTSPYFAHDPHTRDQYSISFTLLPKKPISGASLVFGNDFDHPIRDRLPPGFGTALRIVEWAIDPGLDGDVYSDTPHLYGNALSSVNVLRVGEKVKEGEDFLAQDSKGDEADQALVEGGDGEGLEWRKEKGVPDAADVRKKHFLTHGKTAEWKWEAGRIYKADFFNPYLDFNEFALKLPGFSLSILPYLGGEDYLRYVLKDKDSGEVLFVVVFTLLSKETIEKEEAGEAEKHDGSAAKETAKPEAGKAYEPQADDLD